jgi:hypothetical protein
VIQREFATLCILANNANYSVFLNCPDPHGRRLKPGTSAARVRGASRRAVEGSSNNRRHMDGREPWGSGQAYRQACRDCCSGFLMVLDGMVACMRSVKLGHVQRLVARHSNRPRITDGITARHLRCSGDSVATQHTTSKCSSSSAAFVGSSLCLFGAVVLIRVAPTGSRTRSDIRRADANG